MGSAGREKKSVVGVAGQETREDQRNLQVKGGLGVTWRFSQKKGTPVSEK